jgi:hypothetical protein
MSTDTSAGDDHELAPIGEELTVTDLRDNEIGYDEPVTVEFTDDNERRQTMPGWTRLSHYSGPNSRFSTLTVVLNPGEIETEYRAIANGGDDAAWGDLVHRPTDNRDDDTVIGEVDRITATHTVFEQYQEARE